MRVIPWGIDIYIELWNVLWSYLDVEKTIICSWDFVVSLCLVFSLFTFHWEVLLTWAPKDHPSPFWLGNQTWNYSFPTFLINFYNFINLYNDYPLFLLIVNYKIDITITLKHEVDHFINKLLFLFNQVHHHIFRQFDFVLIRLNTMVHCICHFW